MDADDDIPCFDAMDDERLAECGRQLRLRLEGRQLAPHRRRSGVRQIYATLPYRHHLIGGGKFSQCLHFRLRNAL